MNKDYTAEGTMAYAQRIAILSALQSTNHNLSQTARHLRIGRTTLYRLIEDYQIKVDATARRQDCPGRRLASARARSRVRLIDGIWYLEHEPPNTSSF
jgi:hypothetical protein